MKSQVTRYPLCAADYSFCEKQQVAMTFVLDFAQRLDADRLRSSLVAAVARFPILRGRLTMERDAYVVLDEAGDGLGAIAFEQADGQEPEAGNPAALFTYAAPIDARLGQPLARLRLTHTPRGTVLCVSITHAVGDGFSYFYFLLTWAALTRGIDMPPPAHVRELLIQPEQEHVDLSADAVLRNTGYYLVERQYSPAPIVKLGTLRWSDEELAQLRADAERELSTKVSDNNILTALVLKDFATRWQNPGDTVHLHTPVDFRRLMPELTPMFFGNATRGAPFSIPYEEVVGDSVGRLAFRLKQPIATVDRAAIEQHLRTIQGLTATGGPEVTRRLYSWHPVHGTLVTNLTRMPIEQVDFGSGPPRQFCSVPTVGPGCYALLRRPGAIEAVFGDSAGRARNQD